MKSQSKLLIQVKDKTGKINGTKRIFHNRIKDRIMDMQRVFIKLLIATKTNE